jgi:intracellular sulfur oxidation DsrE/DsrF family protein
MIMAAAVLVLPGGAAAQSGEALIRQAGAFTPVPNPSFLADKSVEYKVVWDVNQAPAKPSELTPGIARPAGFFMLAEANGVDRAHVHLALIVYGGATNAILTNDAYKAATGEDNPNLPLLKALTDAGVQVIVCGQALAGRKVARDQVLPFVKVATSATFARATLHAQGYATFQP